MTPNDWPTILPRIVVKGAEAPVGFINDVFGASGESLYDRYGDRRAMIDG